MGSRRAGTLQIGLAIAAASILAGCSIGDSGPELEALPDGVASGPGFEFDLPDDWVALSDPDAIFADAAEETPGLDFGSGVIGAGAWALPGDESERLGVNVVIEQVTEDTSYESVITGSKAALESQLGAEDIEPIDAEVAGRTVPGLASTDSEGSVNRQLLLRRGPLFYTVTVRAEPDAVDQLESLTDEVAASWRWVPPTGEERAEIGALRDFSGTGYRVELPAGWRGTDVAGAGEEVAATLSGVDSVWRGFLNRDYSTNVQVRIRPAPVSLIDVALNRLEREERKIALRLGEKPGPIERGPAFELDGEPAGSLLIESTPVPGVELDVTEVVVLHEAEIYTVVLFTPDSRASTDERLFRDALDTWSWE